MERNRGMLLALFVGVEPIVVGSIVGRQWLVLVGIGNLLLILLRSQTQTQSQTKAPLSHKIFSYKSHLSHLQTHNTYFGAIAFLGVLGGVLAYILGGHDTLGNLALGLTTAGIVYWVAAGATHGLRTTGAHTLGKIFGAMILAGAGWVFLGSTNGQQLLSELPTTLHSFFSVPKAAAPSSDTTTSGTIDTNTGTSVVDIPVVESTGSTATGETATEPTTETVEVAKDTTLPNPGKDNTKALSFAQVVPVLVDTFKLSAAGPDVKFTNIPRSSELYPAFKAGYASRFYGLGVNPQNITSCNVYFVMLGIAQKWDISYAPANIFSAYAAEAVKRGQTYGCKSGALVTEANLPW